MPALGSIHAIARAVCTFQQRPCPGEACAPCLERARRAVRTMRDLHVLEKARGGLAWEIAREAHRGQVDKAGETYLRHVARVRAAVSGKMFEVGGLIDGMPALLPWQRTFLDQAASLHDVVEDSSWTMDDLLLNGFAQPVLDMVQLLTKPPGDVRTYDQRIEDLIASGNLGAILIKLADVEDNGDPARLALLPEDQRGIGERYHRARARLHEAATALGWRDPREQAESAA